MNLRWYKELVGRERLTKETFPPNGWKESFLGLSGPIIILEDIKENMKWIALLSLAVMPFSFVACAERTPVFSTSVGTQMIGVRYQFTEESALVETAKAIQELGCDTLKIAVTPKYADDYLMDKDPAIKSALDLVQRKPEFGQVFEMPFRNVMLWLYPFSDTKSGFRKGFIPEAEAKQVYKEIYDFTEYLLKTYSGSGKSFFLGNWEGDWHMLNEKYDYNLDPTPEAIKGAIEWFNLRQKAIADAIRKTKHHDVQVYYYIELNHVRKSLDDERPTIVNTVLPHIKTDFVSWSSYDVTTQAAKMGGEQGRQRVFDALDYIEKHLPESDIPGKRVFIGEYGFNLQQVKDPSEQKECSKRIMKWGLEWGCPFILYWELYCNEIESKTGEHRGFWLIDKDGDKQPAWDLHRDFLKKANRFVRVFEKKNGRLPTQAEYNREAAAWLK